ncbi:MAG: class I SAM-dependent methyltransferase [Bryobacteraceae bacterium]|jgi:ubiquinone/menaquinone biosynthesis C-methylase UbiE
MSLPETDFDRERQWWDAKSVKEEIDSADETINRALRWREIERHLEGTKTILDIGGATGVFSIPLAKRGFHVIHLDLSPEMLTIAREKARDVPNIEFIEGNASYLSQFSDCAFDLVLNMDGAISFSGSKAILAIQETCRVARRKVIVTVSHQAQMAASWVGWSLARTGRIAPAVDAMIDRGEWHQDQFPGNEVLAAGLTRNYLGALKAFLPVELARTLEGADMQVLRCGGLGSLAGLCDRETILGVSKDGPLLESFLDICERFDAEILPSGPGTRLRAGLIAVARRLE